MKDEAKEEIDDGQFEAMAADLKSVWPSRVLLLALGFAAIALFSPLYAARSVDAAEKLVHMPPEPTRALYRWPSSSLSATLAGAQETELPIELG